MIEQILLKSVSEVDLTVLRKILDQTHIAHPHSQQKQSVQQLRLAFEELGDLVQDMRLFTLFVINLKDLPKLQSSLGKVVLNDTYRASLQ